MLYCTRVVSTQPLPIGAIAVSGVAPVISAAPSPCIVAATTEVEVRQVVRYERREVGDSVVYVREDGLALVYPRDVVTQIERYVVGPLARGQEPLWKGVLLIGPPGTGKSTICRAEPQLHGLTVFELRPTIQSKYVGETEANIDKLYRDAHASAPAVVVADDVEWAMASRELASASSTAHYHMSLFSTLASWIDRSRGVATLANTNAGEQILDLALVRGGRLKLIYVPLPRHQDLVLIAELSRDPLIERALSVVKDVSKYAKLAVSLGLAHADWVEWLRTVGASGEPVPLRPPAGRGAGYRRAPPLLGQYDKVAAKLGWGRYVFSVVLPYDAVRELKVSAYDSANLGLIVALITLRNLGLPVLLLDAKEKYREAEYAAQTMKAALIVNDVEVLDVAVASPVHAGEWMLVTTVPPGALPERVRARLYSVQFPVGQGNAMDVIAAAFELAAGRPANVEKLAALKKRIEFSSKNLAAAVLAAANIAVSAKVSTEEEFVNAIAGTLV